MSYKLNRDGGIVRISDGACLPARMENGKLIELDPHSPFVAQLREWLGKGNTPLPADPAPTPPTKEELASQWMSQPGVQALIEAITDIHQSKGRQILPEDKAEIISNAVFRMTGKL